MTEYRLKSRPVRAFRWDGTKKGAAALDARLSGLKDLTGRMSAVFEPGVWPFVVLDRSAPGLGEPQLPALAVYDVAGVSLAVRLHFGEWLLVDHTGLLSVEADRFFRERYEPTS